MNGVSGGGTSGMSECLFPLFLMASLENADSEFSLAGSAFSSRVVSGSSLLGPTWNIG